MLSASKIAMHPISMARPVPYGRPIPAARPTKRRRGSVTVEFAFIIPIMLVFIIGVFDISKAMILYEEVDNASHTIPLSASILAVQPDGSTALTAPQVQQAMSAVFAEMPMVRGGTASGTRSVTMTSVIFLPNPSTCTSNCTYVPNVAWSVPYNDANATGFTSVVRNCGTLLQTVPSNSTANVLTSLRTASVTNPDPILVVDVHYRYTPMFLNFVTGPIDFWSSGYWPVRSVAVGTPPAQRYTTFDLANQTNGVYKCAGF
jgi:Flp pilus assembly protein TadG